MEWTDYLKQKKIDPVAFSEKESERYDALSKIFSEVSEVSFTSQKKFLVNPIRLKFPFEEEIVAVEEKPIAKIKPRPKPGIVKAEVEKKEIVVESSGIDSGTEPATVANKPKPKFRPKIKKK